MAKAGAERGVRGSIGGRPSSARRPYPSLPALLLLLLGTARVDAAPEAAPPSAASSPAPAQPRSLVVPGSPEQKPLALELASDGLWLRICPEQTCAARTGRRLELPQEAGAGLAAATLAVLEIAPGRRVAHVRVPLPGGAWEALLGAAVGKPEPLVIFAGTTGAVSGEDGLRQGDMVWVREGDSKGQRVLVGRVRQDVQLCGRTTILEPRLLDQNLELRGAKVQQLSVGERRGAPVLQAQRRDAGPSRGGNALLALAASSAVGDPRALTDGRDETSWSEGRGGDGRGEFVVLRPLSGVGLVALEFLIRPAGDAVAADGSAPRSLWLATQERVFRIDFAQDAWQTPGVWYRVDLPEKLEVACLGLVLESSYASRDDSRVSFAEVRGISEFQGLEPAQLVARLSTPNEAGEQVVPALLQLGEPGVAAVVGAFDALDALGRVRALDVLEGGTCSAVAGTYARLLLDDDARIRRRAEQRLRGCGEGAWGELRAAFERSEGAAGARLAQVLAELAPALAVELLGPRLATAEPEQRADYRAALHRSAEQPAAEAEVRRLLSASALGVAPDIEVLRALGELLPRFAPQAHHAFARVAAAAQSFEQRYRLLGPAAALAAQDERARAFLESALVDPDAYLRSAAVRVAPELSQLHGALLGSTRDSEVRVREAGVLRLGELRLPASASALRERLVEDPWPLVRASAAQALALLGPAPELDRALGAALEDTSPSVRSAALRALGRRGAIASLPAIRARFKDEQETPEVRASAAQALAALCDQGSLEALGQAVSRLLSERPSADDLLVGAAAVTALGQLRPADLAARLQPLSRARNRPVLGQLATAALQVPSRCPAPASSTAGGTAR